MRRSGFEREAKRSPEASYADKQKQKVARMQDPLRVRIFGTYRPRARTITRGKVAVHLVRCRTHVEVELVDASLHEFYKVSLRNQLTQRSEKVQELVVGKRLSRQADTYPPGGHMQEAGGIKRREGSMGCRTDEGG